MNMNTNKKLLVSSVVVGVLLNITLSLSLSPFATKEQIKPPNGAANLPFFSQIIHMIVHHKQVMFTSSLIVAAIISLSIMISSCVF